jgi:two-component system response regulator FixJ
MRLHQLFDEPEVRAMIAQVEDQAAVRLARLTVQQKAVLNEVVNGYSNKEIAYRVGLSPRTVENHRAEIMRRLEVKSVAALLRIVFIAG